MSNILSRRTKWIYGFGDIGFSLTSTILGAYFAIFLTDVVGVQPGIAAVAIFFGRSWDYINDPLIGYLSDRTRSRWGRRRPFLLFGALPFALAFMLLWTRPPFESSVLLAVYYAFAYVLFDSAATTVYMPYFALTPELTEDYDERTSLTSYRMFFSILGSLIAFIVPIMIIGSLTPANAGRVAMMGVIFGLVSAAPLLLVFWGTREHVVHISETRPGLKESLRAAFRNPPFLFGAGIYLITWVAVTVLQASLLYFLKYVVQREGQSEIIMAAIFVTAILTLPLWLKISKILNKRWAYVIGISFWAVVQMVLITFTPATPLAVLFFFCVLAGIGVGAAHVLPWSIIPDAIEYDEYHTGQRHEGVFYSLITLMQKIASSLAVPLALLVLDWTGYIPTSLVQPQSALLGIRLIIGPFPALLLVIGIIFALRYPLDRDEYQHIVTQLRLRRQAKE